MEKSVAYALEKEPDLNLPLVPRRKIHHKKDVRATRLSRITEQRSRSTHTERRNTLLGPERFFSPPCTVSTFWFWMKILHAFLQRLP